MMRMDAKVTFTYDTDCSCHIKATELIQPIMWGLYHTTLYHQLLIASGRTHTHAYRHSRTDAIIRNQAPATGRCTPGLKTQHM